MSHIGIFWHPRPQIETENFQKCRPFFVWRDYHPVIQKTILLRNVVERIGVQHLV